MLLRALPGLLELALLVYCLIDCLQTDSLVVRNLSKGWWIVLIILLPLVGGIAWLVAGRPERRQAGTGRVAWPSTATAGFPEYERPRRRVEPVAPDDDPDFLRSLRETNRDHEQMLEQWERDLRERERRLRDEQPGDGTGSEPSGEPPAPR